MRALELDDWQARAHALLGMLRMELDYNWPEVDRELRRALELKRKCPVVRLRYAICGLMPYGMLHEAVAELETGVRSDPLSLFVRWWLSIMVYLARRYERVVEEGRHMIALDPVHFLGYRTPGIGLGETGTWQEAVAALEKANDLSGGIPLTLGFLA